MKILGMGMPELLIILAVILLIFGPKNLPKLGGAIGKTCLLYTSEDEDEEVIEEVEEEKPAPKKTTTTAKRTTAAKKKAE